MKIYSFLGLFVVTVTLATLVFDQPSLVLAATSGCASSSPSSNAYSVTVCFSSPSDNSTLTGNGTVTATASVTGTDPGVQRIIFYLDGEYLLTDYSSPYSFTLPTNKWIDGNHTLSAEALMRDGFTTTQQASISVIFDTGTSTPPVNNNHFQPTSGRPPASGQPFIVAAVGDGAGGETNAANVTNLIASLNPNLFLYLGDVYEKGSVAEFFNYYDPSTFFGRFRSITDPTVGNHEYSTGNDLAYRDYWDNIPDYYSFNAGGWHFISMNSYSQYIGVGPTSVEYLWLQQDLAANTAPCTIAYYHHPYLSIGQEGGRPALVDIWKLLAQYKVDIVLNGHNHDYERWVPLDSNGQPNPSGVTEFVVGVGGHGLEDFATTDSRVAFSYNANPAGFGVLLLQLNQTYAVFSYRSTNGSVLDSGIIPCVDPSIPPLQKIYLPLILTPGSIP